VQPTWDTLGGAQIVLLGATDHHGTYHVSSHGEATWRPSQAGRRRLKVAPAWDEVSTARAQGARAAPPNCLFLRLFGSTSRGDASRHAIRPPQ